MNLHLSLFLLLLIPALCGCTEAPLAENETVIAYVDSVQLEHTQIEDEAVALSAAPAAALPQLTPSADGLKEKSGHSAIIDYSHTEDGYVMAQYTAATEKKLKVRVNGPTTTYTYNLTPQQWEVFPLSDGSGDYKITVYQNVSANSYATVVSLSCSVELKDEFAPFLHPNQYVNYHAESAVVSKAVELTAEHTDTLKKVEAVYSFVVTTLSYDTEKAATVQSGYLPVLDTVLAEEKGICFDYAALMTAMLRSQNIPCKLVVGYAGTAYHAWISVWTEESGWLDSLIFFDGQSWHRMDPTFASSADQSSAIMQYIGNGNNYSVKYLY